MKKIILIILFSQNVFAQMPTELLGTWVIDVETTQQKMRSTNKFKEAEIQYMAKILTSYKRIISKDKIEIINGKRKNQAKLTLAQSKGNHIVADVTAEGEILPKFQIEFVPYKQNRLIMRLSVSNQMDDFVWVKK